MFSFTTNHKFFVGAPSTNNSATQGQCLRLWLCHGDLFTVCPSLEMSELFLHPTLAALIATTTTQEVSRLLLNSLVPFVVFASTIQSQSSSSSLSIYNSLSLFLPFVFSFFIEYSCHRAKDQSLKAIVCCLASLDNFQLKKSGAFWLVIIYKVWADSTILCLCSEQPNKAS